MTAHIAERGTLWCAPAFFYAKIKLEFSMKESIFYSYRLGPSFKNKKEVKNSHDYGGKKRW